MGSADSQVHHPFALKRHALLFPLAHRTDHWRHLIDWHLSCCLSFYILAIQSTLLFYFTVYPFLKNLQNGHCPRRKPRVDRNNSSHMRNKWLLWFPSFHGACFNSWNVLLISHVPAVSLYCLREQKHFLHSSRVADDGGSFGQLRITTPSASQLRKWPDPERRLLQLQGILLLLPILFLREMNNSRNVFPCLSRPLIPAEFAEQNTIGSPHITGARMVSWSCFIDLGGYRLSCFSLVLHSGAMLFCL